MVDGGRMIPKHHMDDSTRNKQPKQSVARVDSNLALVGWCGRSGFVSVLVALWCLTLALWFPRNHPGKHHDPSAIPLDPSPISQYRSGAVCSFAQQSIGLVRDSASRDFPLCGLCTTYSAVYSIPTNHGLI